MDKNKYLKLRKDTLRNFTDRDLQNSLIYLTKADKTLHALAFKNSNIRRKWTFNRYRGSVDEACRLIRTTRRNLRKLKDVD